MFPIRIRLNRGIDTEAGAFELQWSEIALARDGSVILPFAANTLTAKTAATALRVEAVVSELTLVRSTVMSLAEAALTSCASLFAESDLYPAPDDGYAAQLVERLLCFEVIDFDWLVSGEPGWRMIDVVNAPDSLAARQLVGFLRMSRPGVWSNYPERFVTRFLETNLGHRCDDLWVFHSKRLFRHHPERRSRGDVEFWFDDAKMGVAILLHRVASLEFLYTYMHRDLGAVGRLLAAPTETTVLEASHQLVAIERLANRISDPLVMTRHVVHDFFREVLVAAAEELQVAELVELTRERLQTVQTMVGMVGAQAAANVSVSIARSTEALTRLTVVLAIGAAVLAVIQVAVAILR